MNLLNTKFFARGKLMVFALTWCCATASTGVWAESKSSVSSDHKNKESELARINIQGTVKNQKGETLPGVSIKLQGSKTTTTTDQNGVFRLNLPTGNETLIFTYIGYKTKTVPVNGQTSVDIVMEEDQSNLDEVVVVGYGTQKKAHLTGAISTIKGEELQDLPLSNVGAALSGRVLGLGVSGGTARPGVPATLTVRNPMSLAKDGGNNQPLYVIDGVVQVNGQGAPDNTLFNSLTSSEIESISVLKDGAAAVYGSRGANGVILVTTKKGQNGDPRISYNGNYGITDALYKTKMLSAYDFGRYMNIMNGPYGAKQDTSNVDYFFSPDELEHFKTINYDWLDPAWSSAYSMNHSLNISGGTDKATYFSNVSYFKQDGNLASLDYQRWNFRAGADVKLAKNLKVGLQVSGNSGKQVKTFNKVGGENDEFDYQTLINTPAYIPPYVDGYPVRIPGSSNGSGAVSQYHYYELQRLNNLSTNKAQTLTFNLNAEYKIPFVEGLSARVTYGRNMTSGHTDRVGTYYNLYQINRTGAHQHIYDQGATIGQAQRVKNDGKLSFINDNSQNYQTNFSLNYAHDFGKHSVSGLFSIEKGEQESTQEQMNREDPLESSNGQFNSAFGAIGGTTTKYQAGNLSYVGRANWAYADKYMAEFLFRADASTKFSPENYWGKFYSLSAGWVISKEDFFHSSWVDYLKIRYGFGKLGKDDTQAWRWRQRYSYENGKGAVFGDGNNSTPSSLGMKMSDSPNPNATWSNDYKNNFGVDAQFLHNRLSTTMELFFNRSTGMLLNRNNEMPITIGGSVAAENYGKADMFGTELEVGWNDKIGADFHYGASVRFSWYDNKVNVGNFNDIDIMYPWNAQPGHSSDFGMWGYDYLGMFKTQQDVENYIAQYNITSVFGTAADQLVPGMLYYRDVRGPLQSDGTFAGPDGIIDKNDQIMLARHKDSHYGISMTLRAGYKSFDFSMVLGGSFGGYREYDGGSREAIENNISNAYESKPAFWSDIYDPALNPNGKYPNPYWQSISLDPSSRFWQVNALSVTVRNINLSYTLPGRFAEVLGISNARVYVTAVNPFNLYNPFDFKGPDGSYESYPSLRTVSFGANFTF